ncbi:hypothetical protein ACN38_g475 [Penicillium nordicum]|uniref:Uncharacterized protein n=1 Tax=Penicillium nordicum TaxID=229535 RepID=A0A0M8PIS5_9EURO|nr:hypothetical protein ACN38_g475 [Penicillium nordicum]
MLYVSARYLVTNKSARLAQLAERVTFIGIYYHLKSQGWGFDPPVGHQFRFRFPIRKPSFFFPPVIYIFMFNFINSFISALIQFHHLEAILANYRSRRLVPS